MIKGFQLFQEQIVRMLLQLVPTLQRVLRNPHEAAVIPEMLDQAERITETRPDELLLDAGYYCESVITTTLEQDISLLCPEGRQPGELKKSKQFQKGHFKYDEVTDSYQCPAGQQLRLLYKPGNPDRPRGPMGLWRSAL